MDSSAFHSSSNPNNSFVNLSLLRNQPNIPAEFVWPENEVISSRDDLNTPIIDLQGFFNGNEAATRRAAATVRAACTEHGFFKVINHGVDLGLAQEALDMADGFFVLPVEVKLRAKKIPGSVSGYSGAHAGRFSTNLPWKEMLSFGFSEGPTPVVEDFVRTTLGQEFEKMGQVYQKYCESMNRLSLALTELLGISLGLADRRHYRKFFEDGCSILRCNYYPPCQQPERALGTGPHCDPTALTILHQDRVDGLQVFAGDSWRTVRPSPEALVVNIGDTFMALSNGKYKSCLHRAVVNRDKVRRSMAFFLCPRDDKLIRPPPELLSGSGEEASRKYPDFTWSDLLRFTQTHYRADASTLENFSSWLASSVRKSV